MLAQAHADGASLMAAQPQQPPLLLAPHLFCWQEGAGSVASVEVGAWAAAGVDVAVVA